MSAAPAHAARAARAARAPRPARRARLRAACALLAGALGGVGWSAPGAAGVAPRVTQDAPQDAARSVAQDAAKGDAQDVAENAAQDVAQDAAKDAAQDAAKDAAQSVAQSVAKNADAAVEREWAVRARALDLAAFRAELDLDLAAPGADAADAPPGDWTRRHAALDALARGLALGGAASGGASAPAPLERSDGVRAWAAARALAATRDPHPNVRAGALEALARLAPAERGELDLAALASDPFPTVRAALADALGGVRREEVAAVLGELCRDPDARVAAAARASLFSLAAPVGATGPAPDPSARRAVAAAQLIELVALAAAHADEGLLEAFQLWSRAGGERSVLTGFAAWCDGAAEDERRRAWRAVAAALELAFFPSPSGGGAGEDARLRALRGLRALFDGWLGAGAWDPRRQRLLTLAGAPGRGHDAALEEALFTALERLARIEGGHETSWADGAAPALLARFEADVRARLADGRESELLHLRYDLLETLVRAAGAARLAARLAERDAAPETLAFLLPELGLLLDGWDAARDRRWLAPERPRAVRVAAAEAFAHTLSAAGDPAAHELCARALADPDPVVVRIAFRALGAAREPPPPLDALRGAYDRADPAERSQLLAWLPRDRPLVPFRDVLLAAAADGGAAGAASAETDTLRARAVELLGTLARDAGVAAALAAHLAAALDDLRALGPQEDEPADDALRARRLLELRVTGLLRALAGDLAGDGGARDPARAEAALAASLGRSSEVGKVAAAQIARGPEPARLAAYLGDGVDRRTRIEAAIGLATHAGEPALERAAGERLLADVDAAAWDLRVRMLDALGATVDAAPEAARFLAEVARDAERAPEDQKRALEALAAAGRLEPARAAAGAGRDAEVRIVALGLLASAGEDLEPYLAALPGERILDADRERLRLFLLRVGAQRGSLTAAREAEILAGPLTAARATQAARFVGPGAAGSGGARIPEPEFAWRGELDALAVLARAGRLGAVVSDEALARLDGRFLVALGERALAVEAWEDARRVLRAAWAALSSDVDAPEAKAQAVRCRLLGLAWTTGRHGEATQFAEALLADRRADRIADSAWSGAFGVDDPERGVDPVARLTAFAAQARAYVALAAGDRDGARRLADAAAGLLGRSRPAAEEQARLEAALAR